MFISKSTGGQPEGRLLCYGRGFWSQLCPANGSPLLAPLISKLRADAALYFPYTGPQKKRGVRKKYGTKLDYAHLPDQYLKETSLLDGIQTNIYQLTMWHKLFPDPLNKVLYEEDNSEN